MDELKQQVEFQKLIRDSKQLMKRDTQYIPNIEQLDDTNKGVWVDHDDDKFTDIFNGLLDYCKDNDEFDTLDWNTVNYEIYDAQYYSEKFPGFDEKIYDILADSTKEENKCLDERVSPLSVKHGEVTIQFK